MDKTHLYKIGQRTFDMETLLGHERNNKNYDETCEDHCDFCGQETITSSFNGHDVFLEGWKKDLACINCAEEFGMVTQWIRWGEMRKFGASDEQLDGFEKSVYMMVDIMINVYNLRKEK